MSKLFKWLKKLLRRLKKMIKKVWNKIRPWLAKLAVVAIVLAPLWAPWILSLTTLPAGLGWLTGLASGALAMGLTSPIAAALVGLGVGAIIDSDATKELVGDVLDVVGSAVDGVADVIGSGAGSLIGGFISNPSVLMLAGGALALWLLLGRDKNRDKDTDDTRHAYPESFNHELSVDRGGAVAQVNYPYLKESSYAST